MASGVEGYDYMFKIVVVGDSGVGKTNLISQFTTSSFNQSSANTIGVEFTSKIVNIEGSVVKAQLWDTAGQERFQAVSKAYYRGSVGGLIVYDVSKRSSFEHLERWLTDMRHLMHEAVIILVGNKTDLSELRAVSEEEGRTFAEEHAMEFVETSAKNASNVEKAFLQLINDVFNRQRQMSTQVKSSTSKPTSIRLQNDTNDSSVVDKLRSCCNN